MASHWVRPRRMCACVVSLMIGTATGRTALGASSIYPIYDPGSWKCGYMDRTGTVVVPPQFDSGWYPTEGLAAVKLAGKWGFIDTAGTVVIPPQYDGFRGFLGGFAAVKVGGRWTFIDPQGNPVGGEFDDAEAFSDGLAAVRVGERWGFVDSQMQFVIPATFESAWGFTEGRAPVRINGRWGFIDTAGEVVIPPQYYWVDQFSGGRAFVAGGLGQEGYIDDEGQFLIQRRFFGANPFSAGVAGVTEQPGSTWGLMDAAGNRLGSGSFESVGLFFDDRAAIMDSTFMLGYIDPAGAMVIPARLQYAKNFIDGLAFVYTGDGRAAYLDTTGAIVWIEPAASPMVVSEPATAPSPESSPVPPAEMTLVGNPYRSRWPDNSGVLVRSRNAWDMILYDHRIYIGGGDWIENTGPIDIYSFALGSTAFVKEYQVPDEAVERFYVFDGRLVVPGTDPRESWALGNIYIKENGAWRKVRRIPNGLHCFDMEYLDGTLYAMAHTEHMPRVLASRDWGQTWEHLVYQVIPEFLYQYDGRLCFQGSDMVASGDWFGACEDGVCYTEESIPRLQLLSNHPSDPRVRRDQWVSRALPFGDDVAFLQAGHSADPRNGPYPIYVRRQNRGPLVLVDGFAEECVVDGLVRGDTLYVLSAHQVGQQWENAIHSTQDLTNWTCLVTFTHESFARSFELVCGAFYVSIGSGWPQDGEILPASTGDIWRVVPSIPMPPDQPVIDVSPGRLDFTTCYGSDPQPAVVTLRNIGCSTLNYTLTADATWLSAAPSSGTCTMEPRSVQVVCRTDGLDVGTHSATLRVLDPNAVNSPKDIAVSLVVKATVCDFDGDRDVDQADFGHMQACLSGFGMPQSDPACANARLDADPDVDQSDLAMFVGCMSGPNRPADPHCLNAGP